MLVGELMQRLATLPADLDVRLCVDTAYEDGAVRVAEGPIEHVHDSYPGALTGDVHHVRLSGRSHALVAERP